MKLVQRRGPQVRSFTFSGPSFNVAVQGPGGQRSDLDVDYADLPASAEIRRRSHPRVLAFASAMLLLGGAHLVWSLASGDARARGAGLLAGLLGLVLARLLGTVSTVFTVGRGEVEVIRNDPQHDAIVGELMRRRQQQLRALYGHLNPEAELEHEMARFQWLVDQGVLSADEAGSTIEAARRALGPYELAARGL